MTTSVGAGRMTTAPPIPSGPPGSRTLRILLLAGVAAVVVVGIVAAVSLFPSHHKAATAPTTPPSADASTSPSLSTAAPSISSSETAATATSGPTTTASADPQAAVKAQIIAADLKFESTLNAMFASTTVDLTPLTNVATGETLTNSEDAVAKLRGQHRVVRGVPNITELVVTSMPAATTAVVSACEDDSPTQVVDEKTGAVIASGFQRFRSTTTMVLLDGVWKAAKSVSGGPAC